MSRGADVRMAGGCCGATTRAGTAGAAGGTSRMQRGTSLGGPPTARSMLSACSWPCSAAAWKKNAAVVFVSQSVADVVNSPRRDVILESCPTKIFLPNPEAEGDHVRRLYESIGLNRRQVQILATALPKRQYYVVSPLGRRLINLGLGPVALSFVGMAGRDANVQVNEQMAAHGRSWPAAWLRARGLEAAAESWMRYSEEGGNRP